MQIVVNISDEEYNRIQAMDWKNGDRWYEESIKAIHYGTPLPKGHWIDREEYDADRWKCSECGRTEQYQENFCPNCGADMRDKEREE